MLVSSANIVGSKISDPRFKSLTLIKNNDGPNIDPCGTTHFISAKDVFLLSKLINCFRYLDNSQTTLTSTVQS